MTLSMMIYGVVLALLVAAAAHFLDRGLRGLGEPTRWVWVGALLTGAHGRGQRWGDWEVGPSPPRDARGRYLIRF